MRMIQGSTYSYVEDMFTWTDNYIASFLILCTLVYNIYIWFNMHGIAPLAISYVLV